MPPSDILNLPMQENDAQAETVRDYLKALLERVWVEQEGFSGKRPFGNSGWYWDLYLPLLDAGVVADHGLEHGWWTWDAFGETHAVVLELIRNL